METAELATFFEVNWSQEVSRCKASVDQDDLETIQRFKSWGDIKDELIGSFPPSIILIQPALRHFNDFFAFFETKLGPRLDASYLWGTIACLSQLCTEDQNLLAKIPRMIKSLAHRAETFNRYCGDATTVSHTIQEACFDMQIQFAEFFTNAIRHIHGFDEESMYKAETPLQLIERRFALTNQELGEAVARVEKLITVDSSLHKGMSRISGLSRCLMIPATRTTRFFNRIDVLQDVDRLLGRVTKETPFRSVAIHGMAGVGKSSIASTYMETRYKENVYDVCLWVRGEKSASLRQSFTDIALRLKLPGAHRQSPDDNLNLVQDWFQSTESAWLVVYDNVESTDILMPYWPVSSKGRAIITTRNQSLAFEPASEGLEVKSWDAMTGSEFLLWLLKRNISMDLEAESDSALALSQRLGGHALVISQLACLIHKFNFSIRDFMIVYLKNPRMAHERGEFKAIWEISFQSLNEDCRTLLGIVSFLMPDSIPHEVLGGEVHGDLPDDLVFCLNDVRLFQCLGILSDLGLIKRDIETGTLSTHRIVQTQFKYFLTSEERQKSFNNTVLLVADVFPPEDTKAGQLYERWDGCNRYIQHAISLRDCFLEEQKTTKDFKPSWQFCDLLNRCQRYFFEIKAAEDCQKTCDVNHIAVEQLEDGPRKEDYKATILSHEAQMVESLGDAERAIRLNEKGYVIRLAERPRNKVVLCYTAANLGYCYSAANKPAIAVEWLDKAREWWGDLPNFPLNIVANKARCFIQLGEFEKAKSLADSCMTEMQDVDRVNWATLGYGYFLMGVYHHRVKEFEAVEQHFVQAQNAWLKGDLTRLHPFNGGCMYRIGLSCLYQGKVESAIKHFNDALVVTKLHRNTRPVEHARVLFKLSEALLQDGNQSSDQEALAMRDEAEAYLRMRDPNFSDSGTEDTYDRLITIFWR
ncbi:pfs domain-containing protein [Emericellopsis atlantica]|uniref:Pfs domain-containing protein n=1 Tax=Emericellopsis atlantica TaxID=2614577 RepID=A0A9P8CKU9_9HYPO|nr:pfs domain-containing protein [Emericellopsis atlantica]KAG9250320.1 pfs domain-containing protein [Emericellopsis atlantica]